MCFVEDNIAELRKMLSELPADQFGTTQNKRTFSRLRGAAVDLAAAYLTASALSQRVKG